MNKREAIECMVSLCKDTNTELECIGHLCASCEDRTECPCHLVPEEAVDYPSDTTDIIELLHETIRAVADKIQLEALTVVWSRLDTEPAEWVKHSIQYAISDAWADGLILTDHSPSEVSSISYLINDLVDWYHEERSK
jgi:hypothetical protein